MAEAVQIVNTDQQGKIRNPLGVIGLMIITLGIYGIVWYYKVNKEMATIGQSHGTDEAGTSPGMSVLAVTLGVFAFLIPPFVSVYKSCGRLRKTQELTGAPEGMDPVLLFLLWVFLSPIAYYFFQTNLNKALEAQAQLSAGGTAPGIAAQPA